MQKETERIDSAELRAAARYTENLALSALAGYSEIPIEVYSGNLEQFPRPSQQDSAAQEGIVALRQSVDRVVASMYALALAAENNLPVPRVLLLAIKPYLDEFRSTKPSAQ
jgi:hypothetical protein